MSHGDERARDVELVRKFLLGIVAAVLLLSGCGQMAGNESGNQKNVGERPDDAVPEYRVISREQFPIGDSGVSGEVYNVATPGETERDYREICEDFVADSADAPAVLVNFSVGGIADSVDDVSLNGTCEWFGNEAAASSVLDSRYSEEEIRRIMDDDGYLVMSVSDMEAEVTTVLEETT